MRLLIDTDIILYRGLFATVDLGYFAGLRACDNMVSSILDRFQYPEYHLVLTGKGNFRKKIYTDYKANRKPESRPPYLHEAREYFKKYWEAIETEGIEADDWIASNYQEGDVIVSSDKDFKQLPARIYNPSKDELLDVDNPDFYFWLQTLVGDSADNVPGLPNPAKAHHKKQPNFTEDTASEVLKGTDYKSTVINLYQQVYGEQNWFETFDRNCRLLFLQRKNAKEYYELYR
jgi:DNA polymerase-1